MPLGARQYRAVLDLVGEAHDAQDLDELRSFLLPGLKRMVPADYVSYNEVASDGATPVALVDPELPASAHAAWERHALQNPLLARFMRTRDTRPYRFTDVADMRLLRGSELFREVYRPLGLEHQIAFGLPSPPSLTIGVALSRGGSRNFSDDERSMLDLARPHLIQAYRNAQLRERLGGALEAVRAGLEARRAAALVIDGSGRVVLATTQGRRLAGKLGADVTDGEPLPSALADRVREGGTRPVTIDGAPVLSHVVRTAEGTSMLLFETPGGTLSPAALEGLGLTRREADVMAALARGCSTERTARELGVSPRTVHKHCQSIHAKLGVSDRAGAVATAWAAVATGERG